MKANMQGSTDSDTDGENKSKKLAKQENDQVGVLSSVRCLLPMESVQMQLLPSNLLTLRTTSSQQSPDTNGVRRAHRCCDREVVSLICQHWRRDPPRTVSETLSAKWAREQEHQRK